jgi:hypothetical protein
MPPMQAIVSEFFAVIFEESRSPLRPTSYQDIGEIRFCLRVSRRAS